jgi:hypothetical protein
MGEGGNFKFYVPLSELEKGPVTLHFRKVPISLVMTSLNTCLVSVPPMYRIEDSDAPAPCISATVNLGTSFLIWYEGVECEVRIGRRITVSDRFK